MNSTFRILCCVWVCIIFFQCSATAQESKSKQEPAKPLPNVCEVCSCTDALVNCSSRGLTDHFQDSQWIDKPIKELSLAGNTIIHLQPFPPLVINKLDLRHNRMTKIDNMAFKNITNLTDLDLSYNQLTPNMLKPEVFEGRFSPVAYEPLAKLTRLNLANNALHTLHQDLFEHIEDLKVLILSGNPLKVIDHPTAIALSSIPYLEELDLSYCELRSLPEHIFHAPRYLKTLNLNGNRLKFVPNALESAEALETLHLDENILEVLNFEHGFPHLPKLKELNLCCITQLTSIGRGAFSQLTALERLSIHNCPHLAEISENALIEASPEGAVWPPLKGLILSDNALKYLPAGLVGRWDRLEELDLMNNEWSCDCDNQYLINNILPTLGQKLMGEEAKELKCSSPPELQGRNLTSLAQHNLRCLDAFDARPEKDAAILVGVLIGLLLAIPVALSLFIFWRRGFLFCGSQSPATFSRAFYKRTANDDDL